MKKASDNALYDTSQKAMEELFQSNLDTMRELIDIEFNYANLWHEYINAQFERLSNSKDITDIMAIESGLNTEYSNKFSEAGKNLFETMSNTMQKQMECMNIPADSENLFRYFQQYANLLNPKPKKSKATRNIKN